MVLLAVTEEKQPEIKISVPKDSGIIVFPVGSSYLGYADESRKKWWLLKTVEEFDLVFVETWVLVCD